MNKNEFKAISMIAKKMNWQNKPVECVIETVNQMVRNDQALGLDCYGECDDYEETLLSIATWDIYKIVSCLYTWDYTTHCNYWHFLKETGMSGMEFHVWMTTYDQVKDAIAEEYNAEYEAYLEDYYSDYDAEIMRDVMWMNHHC
jgi:hypothetical protein